ncbi:MAG TPA: iron-containing alcohol dehydrogenase [Roseiflexaceae bacterium]|nr:iron-containing alcohol dehydrogenase [Roseiflexaceae bacterium]
MIDFFEFQLRPRVLYKAGLVDDIGPEIANLGVRRALLVADKGVAHAGLLDRVRAGLEHSISVAGVFAEVPPNSSVAAVEQGAAYARECAADLIVAVGGGSPIDTAKAIRILVNEGGRLYDYEGYNLLTRPLIPMIAIPTTAGTGSEVTAWAVIRDETARMKLSFSSIYLAPDLAILDPEMTRSLPPELTAATGMDALVHAIESFVGSNANPISDSLALQAIDMISNNLRDATYDGNDIEPRGQMLIASCIAGMAFSSGGGSLGIVHALAHALGGAFEVHHGTANSILLPYGMQFNSVAVPNRFARIARAMGVNSGGRPEEDVIADGIDAVRLLAVDCGLPTRLGDIGVPEDALPAVAETALGDAAILTNPRPVSYDDILELARAAW